MLSSEPVEKKYSEEKLQDILYKAFKKALLEMGKPRVSLTLPEITITLMEEELMKPLTTVKSFNLNPGQTVICDIIIPAGKIYVVGAVKIDIDPDFVNSFILYFDSLEPKMIEPAAISSRYADMIYFWRIGTFLKAEKFIRVEITNNSSDTSSFFSILGVWGVVDRVVWEKIVEKYFKVVREEFRL